MDDEEKPKKPAKRQKVKLRQPAVEEEPGLAITPDFKASVIAMVIDEGRSPESVAMALNLSRSSVYAWVRQARLERDLKRPGELTTDERRRLVALEAENRKLKMERELLKNHLARPAPSVARETPVLLRWVDRGERPSAFW